MRVLRNQAQVLMNFLHPISKDQNLLEILENRARSNAGEVLYTFLNDGEEEALTLTYDQLLQKTLQIASRLHSFNARKDRALLLYPPGLDYIAAFFGCLYAEVIAVPAYPPDPYRLSRTLPRLLSIIQDSNARFVLTTRAIQAMAPLIFEQAPELEKLTWIATDEIAEDPDPKSLPPRPVISPNSLAFLQYTSGSTGQPQEVMLTHGNLLHNLHQIEEKFAHPSKARGVIWLPPYHDMGLIGGILQPLFAEIPTVLMSPLHFLQKPFRWLKAISDYRGTTSGGPNFAYELCLRKITPEQRKELDLSSWCLAFTGAEPIRAETLARFYEGFGSCGFRREAFYPCYGLAEATLMVSGGERAQIPPTLSLSKEGLKQHQIRPSKSDEDQEIFVSCGTAVSDLNVKIIHPDTLTPCLPDEVGEIWICGPSIAQGYWEKHDLTVSVFQAKPGGVFENENLSYLRTGDLGFLQNGELFITGRLKDVLIIRGQNHYPQDLEATIEKVDGNLRPGCGAAFSITGSEGEEAVIVHEIDPVPQDEANAQSLLQSIHQAILKAHELEPAALVLIPKGAIAKTSSGKISRHLCREEYLEGKLPILFQWKKKARPGRIAFSPVDSTPPSSQKSRDEIASWLTSQISLITGLNPEEIDPHRSLIDYGLDSKDAINLSGDLENFLGEHFPPTLLWKYPTLDALAEALVQKK